MADEMNTKALKEKIKDKSARVCVIGLGYVGLPLAIEFARAGFPVIGLDIDVRKTAQLARGESYIPDVASADVKNFVQLKHFSATDNFDALNNVDIIFICVPTPFDRMKAPDLGPVISATQSIMPRLQKGQLVILQSTTFPGTTEEIVQPILEKSGLHAGADFHLAFSPERIDPGATSSAGWNVKNTPKVLGGLTPRCTELAKALLTHLTPEVHVVSSPRAAEMSKLLENIFRSVNIALVNELALLSERMGIDFWEVIDAAKTKPFGFMPFYPSAGVGGHCLSENEFLFVRNENGVSGVRFGEYFVELERQHPETTQVISDVKLLKPKGIQVLSFDFEEGQACFKPLQALSCREYSGTMVEIVTTDRRTLSVTDDHPMIVWTNNTPQIRRAADLQTGDELIVPTCWPNLVLQNPEINLIPHLTSDEIEKVRVAPKCGWFKEHQEWLTPQLRALEIHRNKIHEIYRSNRMPLKVYLELEKNDGMPMSRHEIMLRTGRGPSWNAVPAVVRIDDAFARLVGYYLSEGCITKDKSLRTRFVFNSNEREYIDDVCGILGALGLRYSKRKDKIWNALQIKVSSNLFGRMIRDVLGCGTHSTEMRIPEALLAGSAPIRSAVLSGLLRGDGDISLEQRTRHYYHKKNQKFYNHYFNFASAGYFSSSPHLFQQTVALAQGLGFVPTFKKNKPYLRFYGQHQLASLMPLFDGAKRAALESYGQNRRKKMPTKSFTAHENFATVPIRQVSKKTGRNIVYSAEVEDTHTFVTSFGILTHNCIPVDPYYLSWKAREFDFYTKFIELAAEINQGMPFHVVKLIEGALNRKSKTVKDAKVLVLGVAFKPNVDDARNSPAERVIELLLTRGAQVQYHDPFVPKFRVGDDVFHREQVSLESVPLTEKTLSASDAVVIVSAHRRVDYALVVKHASLIIDTANATAKLGSAEKIVRIGAPVPH